LLKGLLVSVRDQFRRQPQDGDPTTARVSGRD
jgi:hypothetical protein